MSFLLLSLKGSANYTHMIILLVSACGLHAVQQLLNAFKIALLCQLFGSSCVSLSRADTIGMDHFKS